MLDEYAELLQNAKSRRKEIKGKLKRLNSLGQKKADALIFPLQEEITEKIDCLQCANCCKTTSPIYRDVDIKRVSKAIGEPQKSFVDNHLFLDSDGHYALKTSPCMFLQTDNCCSIYKDRPLACKEFPHTDRKNFIGINKLNELNSRLCPIVAKLLLDLKI